MKNKNFRAICIISSIMLVMILSSCNNSKNLGGYYSYETECLGSELDGSYTLRAWGIGRNQVDALSQARKKAVRDIIFKGISKGKSECEIKPILLEVNAAEKYKAYFDKFFADNGAFEKYVNYKDKRTSTFHRERTEDEIKYGVTVRVLYNKLVETLNKDGILKN